MPRETFEKELQKLQEQVLVLGSMVEKAIVDSVEGLKQRDMQASQQLIAYDKVLNRKRFDIENEALILIATQQPMASDLRVLAAVLEIATELERIGDYAKGIAKINILIGEKPLAKPLIDIPRMADKVSEMLHQALDAFVHKNVELARSIPKQDDEIDDLYNQIYRELMSMFLAHPQIIEDSNYLLWVAHNLERAADRVTNICERVVFTVTGKMVEMDSNENGFSVH